MGHCDLVMAAAAQMQGACTCTILYNIKAHHDHDHDVVDESEAAIARDYAMGPNCANEIRRVPWRLHRNRYILTKLATQPSNKYVVGMDAPSNG